MGEILRIHIFLIMSKAATGGSRRADTNGGEAGKPPVQKNLSMRLGWHESASSHSNSSPPPPETARRKSVQGRPEAGKGDIIAALVFR